MLALERFISKRVDINYHARLVLFLRDKGIITQEEADAQLHPAVAGGYKTPSLPGPLGWAGHEAAGVACRWRSWRRWRSASPSCTRRRSGRRRR